MNVPADRPKRSTRATRSSASAKSPRPKRASRAQTGNEAAGPIGLSQTTPSTRDPLGPLNDWFTSRGWAPFAFQHETWRAYLAGESGLIHATTGTGKTYAAWGGPVLEWLQETAGTTPRPQVAPPLRVLWITPLRALAADTEQSLTQLVQGLEVPFRVECRTGDTSSALRARQREHLPTALITTPESLSLLLCRPDHPQQLRQLRCVVMDEWHELLGSKRGVQAELCLARLKQLVPGLRIWGLSATLGNLDVALETLVGFERHLPRPGRIVSAITDKTYHIESMIPAKMERFPWVGHIGLTMLPQVVETIAAARTTLVFTNTRGQSEIWYQAILKARPDWAGQMAIHHGSLDQDVRRWVEESLKTGQMRCVVCTSSLDLGVDFAPVEQVIQVGSPKGIARLLQRAGRSGHQPGVPSKVLCVPTHAIELVEFAASREAAGHRRIERREPRRLALDVLVQHAVTIALGSGFRSQELLDEVRQTMAFRELSNEAWQWILEFIHRGGSALSAYPEYQRVALDDGFYHVTNPQVARRHRMSIGTIVSDNLMSVQYQGGARLGTIEESFISRLKPGDCFTFSGRVLELVRIYDLKAYVRPAPKQTGPVARWQGSRMPLSTELARAVRDRLDAAQRGQFDGAEMQAVAPILAVQADWSCIPTSNDLLVEQLRSREGYHVFLYPFEGRLVHEGLAGLLAHRLARRQPQSFSMAINDYGLELLSARPIDITPETLPSLLSREQLMEDIVASLNSSELAKRHFREVARIAGLIFQGFPGAPKSARHLQASAGLLYDVFRDYDPQNLLLHQAQREVLEQQLELQRLDAALARLARTELKLHVIERPTPLAFPLLVDRLRDRLSSEQLSDRIQRMQARLEQAADKSQARKASPSQARASRRRSGNT